jgi:hypothetical protein
VQRPSRSRATARAAASDAAVFPMPVGAAATRCPRSQSASMPSWIISRWPGRASSWANQRRPSSSTLTDTSVDRGRASKRIGERIRTLAIQGCRGVGSAALVSTRLMRQGGAPHRRRRGGLLGVVGVDPSARDGRVPARQRSRRRRVVRLRRRVGPDGGWGHRRFRSFSHPLCLLSPCVFTGDPRWKISDVPVPFQHGPR